MAVVVAVSVTRMPTQAGLHPQIATFTTVGNGMFPLPQTVMMLIHLESVPSELLSAC